MRRAAPHRARKVQGTVTKRDGDVKKGRRPYAARVDTADLERQLCLAAAAVAQRGAAPRACARALAPRPRRAAPAGDAGVAGGWHNHTDLVKVVGHGQVTREECAALGERTCRQRPTCTLRKGRASCTADDSWTWREVNQYRGQLGGSVAGA